MNRQRPARVQALTGIGVDAMGALAGKAGDKGTGLRLENLDTDIPPNEIVHDITTKAATSKEHSSYLPFIGQLGLRDTAAEHVSRMTGGTVHYSGEQNCAITAGGLSGVLNTLLATVEAGEEVLMTDPTYSGLINRVKLAGAVPVFVPLEFRPGNVWNLYREKLRKSITSTDVRVTVMLVMSLALPSGFYFDEDDWETVSEVCIENDTLLIYDNAFERLLFDGREVTHPAKILGKRERMVTVGSASKELRMIGWRVGWIVGPEWLMPDVVLVCMANVVVPVGIAQKAVQAALQKSYEDVPKFVEELQARRDILIEELEGLLVGIPSAGWAFIVRVDSLGWTGKEASQALVKHGIFVTQMDGWREEHGQQYFRIVFANEPCERLKGIGAKVRAALKIATQISKSLTTESTSMHADNNLTYSLGEMIRSCLFLESFRRVFSQSLLAESFPI